MQNSSQNIRVGTKVSWTWGRSKAEGKVARRFESDVERRIKGKIIKRTASPKEPAFLIQQVDGARVLKSQSELHRISGASGKGVSHG